MSLEEFRQKIQHYRRLTGYSQQDLATALGQNYHVLSQKLNGKGKSRLTYPDIRQIIKVLVEWEALTTKNEVLELAGLMGLQESSFGPTEWAAPPLNRLVAVKPPPLSS